jgi:hypothetical protein
MRFLERAKVTKACQYSTAAKFFVVSSPRDEEPLQNFFDILARPFRWGNFSTPSLF